MASVPRSWMTKRRFDRSDRNSDGEPQGGWPRRDFLGASSTAIMALAAGACTSSGDQGESAETGESGSEEPGERIDFDAASIPESLDLFPRTPIAGEMKTKSFFVSGFVALDALPEGHEVVARVWQDTENPGEVFSIAEATVVPDARGFFKLAVDGLRGGEWYQYGVFTTDGVSLVARGLIGRVRTAHEAGVAEPVRVALAACIGRGILPEYVDPADPQPVEVWDTMLRASEQEYDLLIHLGDQGYMDQVYDAGGSLDDYLNAWGAYHGGGYRQVYPRSGLYFTWDDHEVTNNGTVNPWTTDPVERERIANAQLAYYTVMPIDAAQPGVDPLWRSFRWGDTVEFIVLDCRSERSAPEDGTYIGQAQYDFLVDRLQNSPCKFKCVVNSVPFARLNVPSDAPLFEQLVDPKDRWEGYVSQRASIQALVSEQALSNIVWVTGDVHMCYLGQVEGDPVDAGSSMWEVCVTSGNTNPLASELPEPQFAWKSQEAHLPLVTFDPENDRVRVEFIDTDGNLAFSRDLEFG